MLKVKMLPHISWYENSYNGISAVVKNYFRYLPDYDIELVDPKAKQYDLLAVHAGSLDIQPPKTKPIVSHNHGLYWTADYDAGKSEYHSNRIIVNILHYAKEITVPSDWVAETFRRDMRLNPHVVGHGVNWQEWQHNEENRGYVLAFMKDRTGDVCDNSFVPELARQFPKTLFLVTFVPNNSPKNVMSTRQFLGMKNIERDGTIPHSEMRKLIQGASVVMSPIKETFGILPLETMAAGKPILGINKGGNVDLVEHGQTGYLYNTQEEMYEGLNYCLEYGKALGDNGREKAKQYTWQRVCEQVAGIYRKAIEVEKPYVDVVIPVYNKPVSELKRCVKSVIEQTHNVNEIIVIDDGSEDSLSREYDVMLDEELRGKSDCPIRFYSRFNEGVAIARNFGIMTGSGKYICCLDSDDWLDPEFLEVCVNALENDNSLSLAYTGLTSHEPDGTVQLSPGNPHWDYDRHLTGGNTVWTCNVFRRSAWERLGGYRQRYAPEGAGAEDGELWLRFGAYGLKCEKADNRGLFHYSWKTGLVTGNPEYRQVDYMAWHPWTKDNLHPMASYATPINKISHPIRQYDEPVISVIIPVGPGHERYVIDALDSLEAQSFRKWEVIVVWDCDRFYTPKSDDPSDDPPWITRPEIMALMKSYPYARLQFTPAGGAGYARNRGVEIARAPFLLFLDADDTLRPFDALDKMLRHWNDHQAAIYTDYVGQATIDEETAIELQKQGRLDDYNPKTGEAIIAYPRAEFDCKRALRQPTGLEDAYNWNVVTTLLPKVWHEAIGGFDESMETLEDWDYWLRLAKNGYCFKHLPEKLVRYRLKAGDRHVDLNDGRQKAANVLKYMKSKHESIEIKDTTCGCKDKSGQYPTVKVEATSTMNDNDFVLARYIGRRGNHHIRGAYKFTSPPQLPHRQSSDGNYILYYGYADNGHETLVHKQDINLMVGKWQVLGEVVQPQQPKRDTPPPVAVVDPKLALEQAKAKAQAQTEQALSFNLTDLSPVTKAIAKRMTEAGLDTPNKIRQAGVEGLTKIKGIAKARAEAILDELR